MTDNHDVLLAITDGVATITLNRPKVHNAFNDTTIELILTHLATVRAQPNIRALVLTHSGPNFCAGADLNWMGKMATFSEGENFEDAKRLGLMLKTLFELPIPTIATIQGGAYGGGAGLAAVCKIVLASQDATFCFSEAKLGLIPATISPYVIHAMGSRQALRYFITAQRFTAEEALQAGLCHEVVASEQLTDTLKKYLSFILKNGPEAVKACSHLIRALSPSPISDAILNDTAKRIAEMRISSEGQAGITAFLEKRNPDWM